MRVTPCASCRDRRVKCELLPASVFCKSCVDRGELCTGPVPRQGRRGIQRTASSDGLALHPAANSGGPPEHISAGHPEQQAIGRVPRGIEPAFAEQSISQQAQDPRLLVQQTQTQTLQLQLISQKVITLENLLRQVIARLDREQQALSLQGFGFVDPGGVPNVQTVPLEQFNAQVPMMGSPFLPRFLGS